MSHLANRDPYETWPAKLETTPLHVISRDRRHPYGRCPCCEGDLRIYTDGLNFKCTCGFEGGPLEYLAELTGFWSGDRINPRNYDHFRYRGLSLAGLNPNDLVSRCFQDAEINPPQRWGCSYGMPEYFGDDAIAVLERERIDFETVQGFVRSVDPAYWYRGLTYSAMVVPAYSLHGVFDTAFVNFDPDSWRADDRYTGPAIVASDAAFPLLPPEITEWAGRRLGDTEILFVDSMWEFLRRYSSGAPVFCVIPERWSSRFIARVPRRSRVRLCIEDEALRGQIRGLLSERGCRVVDDSPKASPQSAGGAQ